ncbi:hypothetical protein [Oleomonas cavernae]|uniref:hypothetical protein n=1 Tax=Oleomonas cavernae TaxID=2320859 RepID=UPI001314E08D|nr:hypothetical protein [Oleomonas cavernae]
MASLTTITPRNILFKVDGTKELWCAGDPVRTAFFDGMSIMFPRARSSSWTPSATIRARSPTP